MASRYNETIDCDEDNVFKEYYETYTLLAEKHNYELLFEEAESEDCDNEENFNDVIESRKIELFFKHTCGCKLGRGGNPCSNYLRSDKVQNIRSCLQEATNSEKDMAVLGHFVQTRLPQYGMDGCYKKDHTNFMLFGQKVCRKSFLFTYDMGLRKYYRLARQYNVNGIVPRLHGNTKRLPHNAYPLDVNIGVRTFIENYAEQNAMILPGRIPGYKDSDICLLPSAESKHDIWTHYELSCKKASLLSVGFVTFCNLWKMFTHWIIVSKPMTDLCWKCQNNNNMIYRCSNNTDEEKSEKLKEQLKHIEGAKNERIYYKKQCESTLKNIQELNVDFALSREPCSYVGSMHYSWDYAQQVHYPSDLLQPGPIYFKATRKCGIFGICVDSLPLQYNYLIDEAVSTGKGANATISYLHHFLENHGVGETEGLFHADNCAGQNKNNAFIHYILWRVIVGLHWEIEYSFLIAGHTKFSCDQCFGTLKTKARKTAMWTIYDVANVTESSSSINVAELVGTHDMEVFVPTYNWSSYLETYFKKLKNILGYHHFKASKSEPGVITCQQTATSEPVKFNLLKDKFHLPKNAVLPEVVQPRGLSQECRTYLFNEIRQFCKEGTEDIVAPSPN